MYEGWVEFPEGAGGKSWKSLQWGRCGYFLELNNERSSGLIFFSFRSFMLYTLDASNYYMYFKIWYVIIVLIVREDKLKPRG